MTGEDPEFGWGGGQIFLPVFADEAQWSCANEVSANRPRSRARLWALKALVFFIAK